MSLWMQKKKSEWSPSCSWEFVESNAIPSRQDFAALARHYGQPLVIRFYANGGDPNVLAQIGSMNFDKFTYFSWFKIWILVVKFKNSILNLHCWKYDNGADDRQLKYFQEHVHTDKTNKWRGNFYFLHSHALLFLNMNALQVIFLVKSETSLWDYANVRPDEAVRCLNEQKQLLGSLNVKIHIDVEKPHHVFQTKVR